MRRIDWGKGYEGFAWACLIAAAAWCAAISAGCQLHLHWGEKHYHGGGIEAARQEGKEGKEPKIEANPDGEPGIEIVIPETGSRH